MSRHGFRQPGCVCRDADFWVTTVVLQCETGVCRTEFPSVATRLAVWWSILYRDMTFCVTTTTLQWEVRVYRDRTFSIATRLG